MDKLLNRIAENQVLRDSQQFPVVAIVGPRQVGKTTLAKMLITKLDKKVYYLDLELQEDLLKLENAEFYLNTHREDCIILDEIQNLSGLFPVIRGMVDQHRIPGRFIILGSASPGLIRKSSDSLAGRIAYTQLYPLNIMEMEKQFSMERHWFSGGFPDSVLAKDIPASRNWLRNFVQTYTDKDLPILGMPAAPMVIRRFLTMLANYQGGIWNASNFAKSMGLTYPTINRYLDFLEDAFLVARLNPYSHNIKKRLVKSPKVYIRDSGVLHYLASITDFEQLQGNILIGNSWEGYVIEQIRELVSPDISLYYYRTHNGAECDLVLVKGLQPVSAIEIKYTSAPGIPKGFNIAIEDLETNDNYIITPYSDSYMKSENIHVCNLLEYLDRYLIR